MALPAGDFEKMGVDVMLQRFSGEFGLWHLRHLVLVSLAWLPNAFHTMVMIFADHEPAWRCTASCSGSLMSVCNLEPGSWEWVGGNGASIVSSFGLVCGDKYKIGLVQSAFFAGSLIVAPSYWVYFLLRFLTGISAGGVGLAAFVLATEPAGPTKRGAVGMSTFYFYSVGLALLSCTAYFFRQWRSLYVVTSLPSLLYIVAALPFISESPRWLLVRGRISEALTVMGDMAKTNGNHLPNGVSLALDNQLLDYDNVSENRVISGSLFDVIKSPLTRIRLILLLLINLACSIGYYGLTLNAVNIGTDAYLNVFLNGVFEIPAYIFTTLILGRCGRRTLVMGTMGISGTFCLLGSTMKGDGLFEGIRMFCGFMGIFGVAGTFNLLFIYASELFPTVVRNAALGCVTQGGQLGAILAPMVVVMGAELAFAVIGLCGVLGAILSFYLPETLNKPLYDTMSGLESAESDGVP
ncbi:organic cation/carnitine transporter 4-like isoform X2 [Amborella trichopoda]|uniref:organic cation/carnitine transporter 4-like isoform X2 n=1 Tax=Amborella trichopoda TaxID=13333 RepID=UPI0009BF56CE|nr:organic cation/carnitine transporter 4-like isoform X2 [Amborella trichopoda]|eukprot:XP_020527193.1 organic cation/carnitine transporter 4-like isoform X2 [Amborella trichopoda]